LGNVDGHRLLHIGSELESKKLKKMILRTKMKIEIKMTNQVLRGVE